MAGRTAISPETIVKEKDFKVFQNRTSDEFKSNSLTRCAKKVFTKSLIPSVVAISRANTWKEKLWKILLVVLCSLGFIYQAVEYFSYYFRYPTTIEFDEYYPTHIVLPAVTFCSNNRISIHKLCEKYNWYCKPYNDEDYCEKYPRYCFPPYKTLNKVKNEDYEDHIKKEKLSWNETFEFSSSAGVVYKCFKVIGQVTFNCSNDVKGVAVTTVENFPAYCFSVGSQIGKPDSRAEFNPNYLNYQFVLNTLQEEYFDLDDPVLIYVGVHDSKQFSNPLSDGVALHGGFKYKAFVTMTEVLRLASPHNSNCRDYISLWRKNSGNGPLTRYECIERCKLLLSRNEENCIDQHINYPHTLRLCEYNYRGEESVTHDVINTCNQECPSACYESTYEVKYVKVGRQNLNCQYSMGNQAGCMLLTIDLSISFERFHVKRHTYQPKLQMLEMFSSLSICLVMWLGMSLVAVLDVFEMIIKLIYHFLRYLTTKCC